MCKLAVQRAIDQETEATLIYGIAGWSARYTGKAGRQFVETLNGWYRQQLLKLLAPAILDQPDVLVIDSDSYPIRSTAFMTSGGKNHPVQRRSNRCVLSSFHRIARRRDSREGVGIYSPLRADAANSC